MRPLFWKFRVFRNNFLLYLCVLGCIGELLVLIIGASFVSRSLTDYHAQSAAMYESLLEAADSQSVRAEDFLQSVYSDSALLNDFLNYFDKSAEQYFTSRLLNAGEGAEMDAAFVDACKRFSAQLKGTLVQINFRAHYPGDRYNSIFFRSSGSVEYAFQIDGEALAERTESPGYGYLFQKTLPNPVKLSSSIGEVEFLFDLSPLLNSLVGRQHFLIFSSNGKDVTPIQGDLELSGAVAAVLAQGKGRGTLYNSSLRPLCYTVYHSEKYGFWVITVLEAWALLRENALLLTLTVAAVLLCLGLVVSIIGVRMNYDAAYLDKILAFIYDFQNGNFTQEKIPRRHDEYSLIADALNDMSDKIKAYIEKEYLLKLKQQQTEMMALENQINPHFLYNTLEIIRSRACVNGDRVVADAIYNLGGMYRSIIKTSHVITVDQELQMLAQYLRLMEFKYEDNFYYQIEVAPELRRLETVKFWMQPIVENFFAHGFQRESSYNIMIVMGEETPEGWLIEFVNNGRAIDEDTLKRLNTMLCAGLVEGEGVPRRIGLQNVYARLRYFYGVRLRMSIENNQEGGVTVRILVRKGDGTALV